LPAPACYMMAIVLQFSVVAAAAWLVLNAHAMYTATIYVDIGLDMTDRLKRMAIGWGIPFLLSVALAVTNEAEGKDLIDLVSLPWCKQRATDKNSIIICMHTIACARIMSIVHAENLLCILFH